MEMDLTGLWTWTVPLWGLGLLVFVLAAVLTSPAEIVTRIPGGAVAAAIVGASSDNAAAPAGGQGGGARSRRH